MLAVDGRIRAEQFASEGIEVLVAPTLLILVRVGKVVRLVVVRHCRAT